MQIIWNKFCGRRSWCNTRTNEDSLKVFNEIGKMREKINCCYKYTRFFNKNTSRKILNLKKMLVMMCVSYRKYDF